jgi:hypothetical protein
LDPKPNENQFFIFAAPGSGSALAICFRIQRGYERNTDKNRDLFLFRTEPGAESHPYSPSETAGPCEHAGLKPHACRYAILGATCTDESCGALLEHDFTPSLRAELGREFCIQYLRERACAKSFPPFLCQAKLHVYDVADLCRYYGELYAKMTKNCASCSQRAAEQSLLAEQPVKPVATAVAAEKSDAEKPDAEIPLRISCPHIQASPNPLCRRMQSCKESACEAAHSLSPAVRLPFCAAFLRSGGYCAAAAKCPRLHLNHMQLQTKYTMLLKQAVLACRSCAFNCKLFNPASKKHQLPQICNADFIGSCQRPTCQFVHMGEVKHLGLPPYCKTFAQTEACANRQGWKKPVKKKSSPVGFLGFLGFF